MSLPLVGWVVEELVVGWVVVVVVERATLEGLFERTEHCWAMASSDGVCRRGRLGPWIVLTFESWDRCCCGCCGGDCSSFSWSCPGRRRHGVNVVVVVVDDCTIPEVCVPTVERPWDERGGVLPSTTTKGRTRSEGCRCRGPGKDPRRFPCCNCSGVGRRWKNQCANRTPKTKTVGSYMSLLARKRR